MADNVPITAGTGTNIATDQLATGEHVQYVKLMDGALDGTTKLIIGANGAQVDVKALPALPAGSNTVGSVKVTDGVTAATVKAASTAPVPADTAVVVALSPNGQTTTTAGTALSAANAIATLTLAAPGAGLFHYITRIVIRNINPTAAAIAASAVTLAYTSTNLPGSLAWSAGNALAAGAEKTVEDVVFDLPLKSSVANTATTIVSPAIGAGGLCRITAYYYAAA